MISLWILIHKMILSLGSCGSSVMGFAPQTDESGVDRFDKSFKSQEEMFSVQSRRIRPHRIKTSERPSSRASQPIIKKHPTTTARASATPTTTATNTTTSSTIPTTRQQQQQQQQPQQQPQPKQPQPQPHAGLVGAFACGGAKQRRNGWWTEAVRCDVRVEWLWPGNKHTTSTSTTAWLGNIHGNPTNNLFWMGRKKNVLLVHHDQRVYRASTGTFVKVTSDILKPLVSWHWKMRATCWCFGPLKRSIAKLVLTLQLLRVQICMNRLVEMMKSSRRIGDDRLNSVRNQDLLSTWKWFSLIFTL